ncbi:hypothetical protein PAPYR_12723 [Paratrimastix pyriformis]|uniref:Uncharacterized protein n=1 Tax=Paratrimastix pyriformis TaxID=342808 RepID=A0ABQ8U3M5_9EUKA|nr:hypothetical protein PAPYR_12723 [Paratrimastix pyriformis]
MSSSQATSDSLQWLRNAMKKHENGLARRVRHHYEKDADHLRSDICYMVDFIAEYVPKEFIGNLSSFLFPMLSSTTIEMLDGYDEFKKDPHYRALRNSKSESEPQPPKPKKASQTPPAKKNPEPPASDHAITPTPTPAAKLESAVKHSEHRQCSPSPPPPKHSAPRDNGNRHCPQPSAPAPLVPPPPFPYGPVIPLEAVPVQLVPVPVKTVSVVPLDSGDPGPPQLRARRRRRR